MHRVTILEFRDIRLLDQAKTLSFKGREKVCLELRSFIRAPQDFLVKISHYCVKEFSTFRDGQVVHLLHLLSSSHFVYNLHF